MKILTWNVNGVRTLRQYAPWNELKSLKALLDSLGADIICFQETKASIAISRSQADGDLALVPGFDAFFSFSRKQQGYSGVATFVRSEYAPIDAEEGFSGLLSQPSESNPAPSFRCYGELFSEFTRPELVDLDSEGRCIVTDHRSFVLFNVYFPNAGSDERFAFKMRFYKAIELRANALIEAGRQVIIVGDVNTCHREIDHCDPKTAIAEREHTSWDENPAAQWLDSMLMPRGPFVDSFRWFHPDRKAAFTCWNTLINARPANFGTRIDYILVSDDFHSLWLEGCDILPNIMGSDHCPVMATLADVNTAGETLLSVMTSPDGVQTRTLPRLCAKYWVEFSKTQKRVDAFFTKQVGAAPLPPLLVSHAPPTVAPNPSSSRASIAVAKAGIGKAKKKVEPTKGQLGIRAFLSSVRPTAPSQPPPGETATCLPSDAAPLSPTPPPSSIPAATRSPSPVYQPALPVTASPPLNKMPHPAPLTSAATQWRNLMAPPAVPHCLHGELAKEWTVNKSGPNKGRMFYLCARPVGPEEGKGKKKSVGEFRCDFFAWKGAKKRARGGKLGGASAGADDDADADADADGDEGSAREEGQRLVKMRKEDGV
ncbi:Endonuclease/exonuclease/phosphatase [Blyttiomyces helicus]|uniref:DNA-(apurinic or apyrimidinic site) endonuclease n=1 Tax=Blyttiomyces helicus TaxID=388810 RepID=A0A4P9WK69_9FUNG|nr:Endonuclease/exonuclease/phosphatase [Blyttiomyces helicus]|eukprot:RKO91958.1 Endonuclease/exonuclease/phosphatase [Blyttiomyces helicus]